MTTYNYALDCDTNSFMADFQYAPLNSSALF